MQALQRFFHALLPVPGVVGLNLGLQGVEVFVLVAGQVAVAQRDHMCDAGGSGFKDRVLGKQLGLLRHIRDAYAGLDLHQAVIGLGESTENLQQGRLAGAVAANQSDALPGFQ
ncbi:hypothetical protein D3C85_1465550 [compost metagenome]